MKRLKNILLTLTLITLISPLVVKADNFLPDTMAFQAVATMKDSNTIEVRWSIEPGYHMYRDSLSFTSEGKVLLESPQIPKGDIEYNKALGKTIEQYKDQVVITIPVNGKGSFKLHTKGQGCADAGLCYPPFERVLNLDIHPKTLKIK